MRALPGVTNLLPRPSVTIVRFLHTPGAHPSPSLVWHVTKCQEPKARKGARMMDHNGAILIAAEIVDFLGCRSLFLTGVLGCEINMNHFAKRCSVITPHLRSVVIKHGMFLAHGSEKSAQASTTISFLS